MTLRTAAITVLVVLLAGAGIVYYYAGQEPGPLVKIEKPAAIGGGPVAIDVTVDSLGTKLRHLEVSVEQEGRSLGLFSLDAPGDARFVQETADRIRITRESPASALAGLRDGPARLLVSASRDVLFGARRAGTIETRELPVRRTAPAIALPVSCAITTRRSGCADSGSVVSSHNTLPYGTAVGSTATERPGVSGAPWAPRGPTDSSGSGSSRKNTTRGLLHSISLIRRG